MTGRGYYFQDRRDPLLEEISGEFYNGLLHGRGVCFKKQMSGDKCTGLVITVGYLWNRGTLQHGFEIIVDTNNTVKSIKQFKSNVKYTFDSNGQAASLNDSDDNMNIQPVSSTANSSVPLLSFSSISETDGVELNLTSPRTSGGPKSPKTPRSGSLRIPNQEVRIEQIEFVDGSEASRANFELIEKQSNLIQGWKEKIQNVEETIRTLKKQKKNLEIKLEEATEELIFYHNKDVETEQRLSQYILQQKNLFEEYEQETNAKISHLESVIEKLSDKSMDCDHDKLKDDIRQEYENKFQKLDMEWKERYQNLESQVKHNLEVVSHYPGNHTTSVEGESPTNISSSTNQSLLESIPLEPKRRKSIHRRTVSTEHYIPSPPTDPTESTSETSTPGETTSVSVLSISPHSRTASSELLISALTSSNPTMSSSSYGDEDGFDIESTHHAKTTYKSMSTAQMNANPSFETPQKRENKRIGRPRSNSQDNSSPMSSVDIVNGSVNEVHLMKATNCEIETTLHAPIVDKSETSSSHSGIKDQTNSSTTTNHKHTNSSSENSPTSSSNDPHNEPTKSRKSKSPSNSSDRPIIVGTQAWVSADTLYQKIRENLKKTKSESMETQQKGTTEQVDWRHVLKKRNNE